jgi:serpin B/serpin B11/12
MNHCHKYRKYKRKYLELKYIIYQTAGKINGRLSFNFAINIYDNLDGASNLISPLLATYAISLVHLASLEDTDYQLTNLLGYKYGLEELNSFNRILNNDFVKMRTLILVNYNINQKYIDMTKKLSLIAKKNFRKADLLTMKINRYVNRISNGTIKTIVSPEDMNDKMCIVVISFIYLEVTWKYKFNIDDTTMVKFHKTNMVEMMHQINYFDYYENPSIQMVELPLSDDNYKLGIILPKKYLEQSGIEYSVNNVPRFTSEEVMEFINNTESKQINLYIPKFTHKRKIDMVPLLIKMGVSNLFNREHAQLDTISKYACVSKMIQESIIKIDESGVEEQIISENFEKEASILFKADHAFVYFVRYVPLNVLLFYGDYQGN